MKLSQVDRLLADRLITAEQRDRIVSHYKLRAPTSILMVALCGVGGLLLGLGVALLIASNWDEIPRHAKLLSGIVLLVGAYWGGYECRDRRGTHPAVGEALYLLGSLMFLSNLALVSQVYNISSHPERGVMLWVVAISPLPWVLRSRLQFGLFLLGFWWWWLWQMQVWREGVGGHMEDGFVLSAAVLGMVQMLLARPLKDAGWEGHGRLLERFGLVASVGFCFASGVSARSLEYSMGPQTGMFLFLVLLLVGLLVHRRRAESNLGPAAWVRGAVMLGWLTVVIVVPWVIGDPAGIIGGSRDPIVKWVMMVSLAAYSFLQVWVAVLDRSRASVNAHLGLVLLVIAWAYMDLIESMALTGGLFLWSGAVLLLVGWVMERKRRNLMQRMQPDRLEPGPEVEEQGQI